jgi:hypothetical protein
MFTGNDTYDTLRKVIPKSDLEDLKEISITLQNDFTMFTKFEFSTIHVLITKRLIELSKIIIN